PGHARRALRGSCGRILPHRRRRRAAPRAREARHGWQRAVRQLGRTPEPAETPGADRRRPLGRPGRAHAPGLHPGAVARSRRARMLCGAEFFLDHPKEIVLVTPSGGDGTASMLAALNARFVPNRALVVVAEGRPLDALAGTIPLVAEKTTRDARATAYVCERRVCQRPTNDPDTFARELDRVTPLS